MSWAWQQTPKVRDSLHQGSPLDIKFIQFFKTEILPFSWIILISVSYHSINWSRDSAAGIATGYGLDN
jgi:hypothetical protein